MSKKEVKKGNLKLIKGGSNTEENMYYDPNDLDSETVLENKRKKSFDEYDATALKKKLKEMHLDVLTENKLNECLTLQEKRLVAKKTISYISKNEFASLEDTVKAISESLLEEINKKRLSEDEDLHPVSINEVKRAMRDSSNIEELRKAEESLERESSVNQQKNWLALRYAECSSRARKFLTIHEFKESGFTRNMVREHFQGMEELRKYSTLKFPNYFHFVVQYSDLETEDLRNWVTETVQKENLFSVFASGNSAYVDHALENLFFYHKVHGGIPICIPTEKRRRDIDPRLIKLYKDKKIILLLDDLAINRNLIIRVQNNNNKSMNPFSGVTHINESVSQIVGHRIMAFEPKPVKKSGHPVANISTGTLSHKNYVSSINHNLSGRTASIVRAEDTHFYGFTLIERVNDKIFIPTQIEYNMEDRSFTAYFVKYKDGKMLPSIPKGYVAGDIHENERSHALTGHFMSLGKKLGIPKFYAHDVFNCSSVSHWNYKNKMERAYNDLTGASSLARELKSFADFMKTLSKCFETIEVVASNHDDMLNRQLNDGDIFKDAHNKFLGYLLSTSSILEANDSDEDNLSIIDKGLFGIDMVYMRKMYAFLGEKEPILAKAMKIFGGSDIKNINWRKVEESDTSLHFELLEHGHQASNGSKGNFNAFMKTFLAIISGHTHVAKRRNKHLSVGHNIDMRKGKRPLYVLGGTSSWTVADAVVYDDFTAHHTFCIDGVKSRFMCDSYINALSKGKVLCPTEKEKENPKYPDLFSVLKNSNGISVDLVA